MKMYKKFLIIFVISVVVFSSFAFFSKSLAETAISCPSDVCVNQDSYSASMYKYCCTQSGGGTVNIAKVDLTATLTQLTSANASSVLKWTSSNVTSCSSSDFNTSSNSSKSTTSNTEGVKVTPSSTKTYKIECSGPYGVAKDEVTIAVNLPAVSPSGELKVDTCEIKSGENTCSAMVDWETFNLTSGKATAVTRNNPDNTLVSNKAFGSTTNKVNYGTSSFFLYHNEIILASKTINVGCASGASWNNLNKKCEVVSANPPVTNPIAPVTPVTPTNPSVPEEKTTPSSSGVTTGTLKSNKDFCEIAEKGRSCSINLYWQTINPSSDSKIVSAITKPHNITVATGNSNSIAKDITVFYPGETFYLYHNGKELSQKFITAKCVTGTSWNEDRDQCEVASVPSALPDLTVTPVLIPATETAGLAKNYVAGISNIGGASTEKDFSYFFQKASSASGSGAVDLTAGKISKLEKGKTATATSPSVTFSATETVYLRVCADKTSSLGGGEINESNENNNCGIWTKITKDATLSENCEAGDPDSKAEYAICDRTERIDDTSATISFKTKIDTVGMINYRVGKITSFGNKEIKDDTVSKSHAIVLKNLAPGTTYGYHIHSGKLVNGVADYEYSTIDYTFKTTGTASSSGGVGGGGGSSGDNYCVTIASDISLASSATTPNWAKSELELVKIMGEEVKVTNKLQTTNGWTVPYGNGFGIMQADDEVENYHRWPAYYYLTGDLEAYRGMFNAAKGYQTRMTEQGADSGYYRDAFFDTEHTLEGLMILANMAYVNPRDTQIKTWLEDLAEHFGNWKGAPYVNWYNWDTHHLLSAQPGTKSISKTGDMGIDYPMNLRMANIGLATYYATSNNRYLDWVKDYLNGWINSTNNTTIQNAGRCSGGLCALPIRIDPNTGNTASPWYDVFSNWGWKSGFGAVRAVRDSFASLFQITRDDKFVNFTADQVKFLFSRGSNGLPALVFDGNTWQSGGRDVHFAIMAVQSAINKNLSDANLNSLIDTFIQKKTVSAPNTYDYMGEKEPQRYMSLDLWQVNKTGDYKKYYENKLASAVVDAKTRLAQIQNYKVVSNKSAGDSIPRISGIELLPYVAFGGSMPIEADMPWMAVKYFKDSAATKIGLPANVASMVISQTGGIRKFLVFNNNESEISFTAQAGFLPVKINSAKVAKIDQQTVNRDLTVINSRRVEISVPAKTEMEIIFNVDDNTILTPYFENGYGFTNVGVASTDPSIQTIDVNTQSSTSTKYGECSINKPLYCQNGTLINKASRCGCPNGTILSGDICIGGTNFCGNGSCNFLIGETATSCPSDCNSNNGSWVSGSGSRTLKFDFNTDGKIDNADIKVISDLYGKTSEVFSYGKTPLSYNIGPMDSSCKNVDTTNKVDELDLKVITDCSTDVNQINDCCYVADTSTDKIPNSLNGNLPSAVTDSNGNIHLIYIGKSSSGVSGIYYTKFSSSWSTPTLVTGTDKIEGNIQLLSALRYKPGLTIDVNNKLHLVYIAGDPADPQNNTIYYSSKENASNTWTVPEIVHSGNDARNAEITSSDSKIWIATRLRDRSVTGGDKYNSLPLYRKDITTGQTKELTVQPGNFMNYYPSVVSANDLTYTYVFSRGTGTSKACSYFKCEGLSCSSATKVMDLCSEQGAGLALDGNNLYSAISYKGEMNIFKNANKVLSFKGTNFLGAISFKKDKQNNFYLLTTDSKDQENSLEPNLKSSDGDVQKYALLKKDSSGNMVLEKELTAVSSVPNNTQVGTLTTTDNNAIAIWLDLKDKYLHYKWLK